MTSKKILLTLKKAIIARHRSIRAFALSVGMRPETVSRVIHRKQTLSVRNQELWAMLLDYDVQNLFDGGDA